MGALFALVAFFSWGVGDFLIQKSTRKFGDWISLFYICVFGGIVLLPFVWSDIPGLFSPAARPDLILLVLTSLISTAAALLLFESLKQGKLAVVEPIFAFEIVVTAVFASLFFGEAVSAFHTGVIAVMVIGIMLLSLSSLSHLKKFKFEAGVVLAIVTTVCMGAENFMFGFSSREINPLMVNWFTGAVIALITGSYVMLQTGPREIVADIRRRPALILWTSALDTLGWLAYSYSMTLLPLAVATGISEGYIAVAVSLGFALNKEKIKKHQLIGLVLTIAAAIVLSVTVGS